jgi:hypothetical protein
MGCKIVRQRCRSVASGEFRSGGRSIHHSSLDTLHVSIPGSRDCLADFLMCRGLYLIGSKACNIKGHLGHFVFLTRRANMLCGPAPVSEHALRW